MIVIVVISTTSISRSSESKNSLNNKMPGNPKTNLLIRVYNYDLI